MHPRSEASKALSLMEKIKEGFAELIEIVEIPEIPHLLLTKESQKNEAANLKSLELVTEQKIDAEVEKMNSMNPEHDALFDAKVEEEEDQVALAEAEAAKRKADASIDDEAEQHTKLCLNDKSKRMRIKKE